MTRNEGRKKLMEFIWEFREEGRGRAQTLYFLAGLAVFSLGKMGQAKESAGPQA